MNELMEKPNFWLVLTIINIFFILLGIAVSSPAWAIGGNVLGAVFSYIIHMK